MREAVIVLGSFCGAYYVTLALIALIKLRIYGVRIRRCAIALVLPVMFFTVVHAVIQKAITNKKLIGMKPFFYYWRTTFHFMSIMPIGMDYVAKSIAGEQEEKAPIELAELTRHSAERMIAMGIVYP